ncbi:hypothetical protein OKA05_15430 [Luteolibacter arcticus]|uniref:Uncharacterized protein n=1 Tax=Luteolibacter arcticus TaxID=1581411 RepID=A0ABT3GKB7_9BACT|nr:hypothetical protein [Luteolibacter arcticus]MCW1923958.1 hypothetical protein [Luteolibacter arcticus]
MVLVFGFLKANETDQVAFDAGTLPRGVDLNPFLTELRSELESDGTLIEIQRQLDRNGSIFKTPKWWLRQRIKVEFLDSSGGSGAIQMLFTHHSPSGRERLSESFEEAAKKVVPRIRAKHVGEWLEKIDARAAEIRLAVKAAESKRDLIYRSDIPFIDESEQLENDREWLLTEDPYLGSELSLPGSFVGFAPWWESPPKWAIIIGMCGGYGLMAIFPSVIILEMMCPRHRVP